MVRMSTAKYQDSYSIHTLVTVNRQADNKNAHAIFFLQRVTLICLVLSGMFFKLISDTFC
jgi:hypothetical protein